MGLGRITALALGVSACGFHQGHAVGGGSDVDAPGANDAADATADARSGDAACASWSFTPSNFDPCALPAGTPLVVTSAGGAIDTGTTTLPHVASTQSNGEPLVVIHLTQLDVQGTLTVTGNAAVVFAVDGTATIAVGGTLVARSGVDASCTGLAGAAGQPSTASVGGGGGGGGAAAGAGGDGTNGDGGGHGNHGSGGTKQASMLSPLRAGCSGGGGGTENGAGTPGTGGAGGGGVQISSNTSVSIAGKVDATGSPGGASTAKTGGGGGGSGGAIFLEAPIVHLLATGVVCADGGSGSQGGGQATDNIAGTSSPCTGLAGANAPNAGNYGGGGGNGGYGAGGAMNGTAAVAPQGGGQGGGGGGGGGAGWIHIHPVPTRTVDVGAVITPTDQ